MEDWITVALEEYKTLRKESLAAISNQLNILRFGILAIGGVIFTGFNLWEKPYLPGIIFLLGGPLICYVVCFVWMGELIRMMRAGSFMAKIENRISVALPFPPVLSWENWLRNENEKKQRPQMNMNYIMTMGLLFISAASSIGIGYYKVWCSLSETWWFLVISFAEFACFAFTSAWSLAMSLKLKNM